MFVMSLMRKDQLLKKKNRTRLLFNMSTVSDPRSKGAETGQVQFGLVLFGLVWFGLVCSGLERSGLVLTGLLWTGLV